MMIGLISDTHGLLRPAALDALRGCDWIIHAGDIGAPDILGRLRELAPVTAIRGNIDTGAWAQSLPETTDADLGGVRFHVVHDLHTLGPIPACDIIVSGHSHKPSETRRDGVLYLNPGSAGPRRFKLPITVARLDLSAHPYQVEFIDVR
jgi:putative phosphoesterase